MKFTRRQTLAAALGSLGAGVLPRAQAQTQPFPSQVIKFVIPTPAGGDHDTMMKIIGQKLTDAWGQPCIVESRSGASGAIAAATVSQAPADGYTVLIGYSALLSNTVLMPKPGYRLEDLQPVGMLALTPIAFGVRESLPASTLKQYVALAKTRPGKLSYGSYGQGSGGHFVGELFNMAAGIDTVHVPYKGQPPALQDLIGGQIDAAVALPAPRAFLRIPTCRPSPNSAIRRSTSRAGPPPSCRPRHRRRSWTSSTRRWAASS